MYLNIIIKRLIKNKKEQDMILNQETDKEKIEALEKLGYTKTYVIDMFQEYFNCRYIDLKKEKISIDLINSFNKEELMLNSTIPISYSESDNIIIFASSHLEGKEEIGEIKRIIESKGMTLKLYFAFDYEIEEKFQEIISTGKVIEDEIVDEGVSQWVDEVMKIGVEEGASDIHIEAKETSIIVRYRIDGLLTMKKTYPTDEHMISRIMIRIKNLAEGMDMSEKRRSQDGRISDYIINGKAYDFRVSILKTIANEKVVMRIIDKHSKIFKFDDMGFSQKEIEIIKKHLDQPNGIIYIAGATGTGKTTTLYSMVDYRNTDLVNIYTIEDPVEKIIPSLNQIEINEKAGVTFESTMEALVRQDPDIVVVGEVRSKETGNLALSLSLAGRLVLTTIHANTALDTLSRLYSMGMDPYLVGTSARLIMSQRLVRTVCPYCHSHEVPNKKESAWIEEYCLKKDLDPKLYLNKKYVKANGCEKCHGGYHGRTVIAEMIEVNKNLTNLISNQASMDKIESAAKESGLVEFKDSIFKKIEEGVTTIEESIRVIG